MSISHSTELEKIVASSGLEQSKATYMLEKFQDYFKIAADWEVKAKVIVVTSETQTAEMKMAREGRLFLKNKRVDIEKTRKELKEQSLREGKAIDGISNVLKALIEPTERYLEEQERFVEIRQERAKEERKAVRAAELQSLGLDPVLYNLGDMPDREFQLLVEARKAALQQEKEAQERAEAERIEREKEQERIRQENERLRAENEAKERKLVQERAKAEEEARRLRRESEEREKKLRAEQDAKLKQEREKATKLRAEIKAKEDAEAAEKKRAEAVKEALPSHIMNAYKQGFIDGLKAYAHWKDGAEYVGTTGQLLATAIEVVESTWNFKPVSDPLPAEIQQALNSGDGSYHP